MDCKKIVKLVAYKTACVFKFQLSEGLLGPSANSLLILPLGVGSGQILLCVLPRLANISMFEVVDEEVERCHQSQEDVAESNKRSRYMLDETNQGQLYL